MTTTTATGTTSRPANGTGGLQADDWAINFGGRDGVIEDYSGAPGAFNLTLDNASNEGVSTAAKLSVNGYTLTVPDGTRISLPAPASGSVTYYIGIVYDPVLNVPSAGGAASTAGPVRLQATDTIDTSNGKRFLILWIVTRTTASLSSAIKIDRRRWVGDVIIDYPDGTESDSYPANEGAYPRGTLRVATNRFLHRRLDSAGVLRWSDPLQRGPFPLPLSSGLISRQTVPASAPTYMGFAGRMVLLAGGIQRSSGNLSTGNDVPLGTLPETFRPGKTGRWPCKTSGTDGQAEVRVTAEGVITMTNPSAAVTWIDLSPITFYAEN